MSTIKCKFIWIRERAVNQHGNEFPDRIKVCCLHSKPQNLERGEMNMEIWRAIQKKKSFSKCAWRV